MRYLVEHKDKKQSISEQEFWHALKRWAAKNSSSPPDVWVDAAEEYWFAATKHLLTLSFNNIDSMLGAAHYLCIDLNVGYCPIRYTYKNMYDKDTTSYRLITDMYATEYELNKALECVPGSVSLKCIRVIPDKPEFGDATLLKTDIAKQFVRDLAAVYESPEWATINKLIAINRAISDGRMLELAADPGFKF